MDIGERVIVYVEEKGEYGIVIDDQTAGNNPNLWIYDNSGRGWSAARKGSCAGGTIKLEASGLYFYCGTIPEDSSNDNVEIAGQQANLAILENGSKVWFVVSSQDVEPYVN